MGNYRRFGETDSVFNPSKETYRILQYCCVPHTENKAHGILFLLPVLLYVPRAGDRNFKHGNALTTECYSCLTIQDFSPFFFFHFSFSTTRYPQPLPLPLSSLASLVNCFYCLTFHNLWCVLVETITGGSKCY